MTGSLTFTRDMFDDGMYGQEGTLVYQMPNTQLTIEIVPSEGSWSENVYFYRNYSVRIGKWKAGYRWHEFASKNGFKQVKDCIEWLNQYNFSGIFWQILNIKLERIPDEHNSI